MRRCVPLLTGGLLLALAWAASADVSMTDKRMLRRQVRAEKARELKKSGDVVAAPGAVNLVDGSGLEWFLNTNMTTSSSASGAMSEASYTTSVTATYTTTTISGGTSTGTTVTLLGDAFDGLEGGGGGYNALCVSLTGATGPCTASDPANYTVYNQNGAATVELNGRQYDFAAQTIGSLSVSRKVYVPSGDSFARWLDIVTNNGIASQSVTLITSNNLGSDLDTVIVTTSDGDATAELTDRWVVTGQGYTPTGSCCFLDPRLGHILQGPGAAVGLASNSFVTGDDAPYWAYSFTLDPGETGIIMNFAVAQPSKAAAAAKAGEIAALPAAALDFMSATEKSQVLNFSIAAVPVTPRADFNSDGKEDLLLRLPTTGGLVAWYMDGVVKTGGAGLSNTPASGWVPVGVGDFGAAVPPPDVGPLGMISGDGKPDILLRYQPTGQLVVWYMDGVVKTGGAGLSNTPASGWVPVGIADFGSVVLGDKDGAALGDVGAPDGWPDILLRYQPTGQLVTWFMNGVVKIGGAALSNTPAAGWLPVGVADFNADGKPDILFRNQATGQHVVWYMNGVTKTGGAALSPDRPGNTSWQVAALGDYNGDGKTDIAWQLPSTGDISVWYMNGVTKTGGAATNPNKATPPWTVVAPR